MLWVNTYQTAQIVTNDIIKMTTEFYFKPKNHQKKEGGSERSAVQRGIHPNGYHKFPQIHSAKFATIE